MAPIGTDQLAAFDAADRALLVAEASRFALAEGEVLFRQGEPADALYIVESGRLMIATRLPGDDSVDLAPIGPGEVVGEFALLDEAPRSARVTAAEPTAGWRVSRARFHALLADASGWALRLSADLRRLVACRSRATIARIANDDASDVFGLRAPASHAPPGETVTGALDLITGIAKLAELGPAGVEAIAAAGEALAFPRGARLHATGDPADGCDVVLRGALRSALPRGGSALPRGPALEQLFIHGPGEATGLIGLHDRGRQALLVETAEDSVILRLPAGMLAPLLDPAAASDADVPEWQPALAVILGRQLVRDQRRANRHLGRALALQAFNAAGGTGAGGGPA